MFRSRVLLLSLALILASCARQSPVQPNGVPDSESPTPRVDTAELDRMEQQFTQPDRGLDALSLQARRVYVPAGSVDAIAAAIAQAGDGGSVVLRRGTHTESASIEVDRRVSIVGEANAVVVSGAGAASPVSPLPISPVFHVTASGASVSGLIVQPSGGDGSCVVLVDGASDVLVFHNQMTAFQNSVVVERGDRAKIWSNTIVTSGLWQTGAIGDAYGIVMTNGRETSVLRNTVSNSLFGIWACDDLGVCAFNETSGNYVGIILCKVPANAWRLPDGSTVGASQSAARWLTAYNFTNNNFAYGLLVIDSANHNVVTSNQSTGNGVYDVEFTGDTYRFGFLTPAAFDNTFVAGLYPNTIVKDCGNHNVIIGGQKVDNTAQPCD